METIFGIDSTLYKVMSKFSQIMIINLLWILCSLPIITIGASTTALYYVSLKIAKNEEGNIVKQFFSSFRNNFVQATILWLLFVLVGAILGVNYFYYWIMGNSASKGLQVVFIILMIVYGFALSIVFPVLAKFDNTVKGTIIFSILTSIINIGWSLLIVVISLLIVNFTIVLNGFPIFFAIGGATCLHAYIYNHVFDRYVKKHPVERII
ncbi:YesL family protein [Anaerosporobacter sp.]|uniref:YesL family protein n=1 Tax=Anaerosporobacter sp. TaxID=1872529 RepID=UPI00286F0CE0|nr:YesL family protein [Anaerosporobacter sp.]